MFKQGKKKKVASDMGSRCPSLSSHCQCPLKPRSPQYWNSLVLQLLRENRKQQKQERLKEKPQPGTASADQSNNNNNNNNKPRSPSQPPPPKQKCLKRTSEPEKKCSSTFRNNFYFAADFSGDPYEIYDPLPNYPHFSALYDCRNRSFLNGQNSKSAFNGDNSSSSSSDKGVESVVVYSTPKRPRLENKKVLPVTKVIIIKSSSSASSSSASMKTEKLIKEEETKDGDDEGKLIIDEEA